jgi:hypothetical protein
MELYMGLDLHANNFRLVKKESLRNLAANDHYDQNRLMSVISIWRIVKLF